jgi:hypothetical protein
MPNGEKHIESVSHWWEPYAWYGCIAFSVVVALWYIIYCYKVSKPHKKISLFAKNVNEPIDTDLTQTIIGRSIMIGGTGFSFYISIVYCSTDVWLLPSFPFASRMALAIGAFYVLFLSIKSSIKAIHDYHKPKSDREK